MAYSKTEQLVHDMAEPIATENGCYIYDVEYSKEGGVRYLRVYADREDGGISLDECEAISRALSAALDESDPIKENYFLEVSSPGIERKLKQPEHFACCMGSVIEVGLYKPYNGSKTVLGTLEDFADKTVTLCIDGETVKIPQNETTYVKLHFDF